MVRQLVLIILSALISIRGVCQGKEQMFLDSLIRDVENGHPDTLKVKKLGAISFRFSALNPEKGIAFGTRALELAEKIKWQPGIAISLYNRASNYMAKTQFSEALNDYLLAAKICEEYGRRNTLAGALGNIGGIYAYQKKDSSALVYYKKALVLNKELHNGWNEAVNLCNIGQLYTGQKNYPEALKYTESALKISVDSNYTDIQPPIYNTLSRIYSGMGNYDQTIESSIRAADRSRGEDHQTFGNAMEILGNAIIEVVKCGNDTILKKHFNTSREAALKLARMYLDSAINIGKEINDNLLLKETYFDVVKLYEMQGDHKSALLYHRLYNAANDSVYNEKNTERITQLALEYEFAKKEASRELLQQKKDARQRNVRISISVGLAITLLFLLIVLRQSIRISKERKRSDELLLNILPDVVAKELKDTGRSEPSVFENVTVLFTDFVDFTKVTERVTQHELVTELDVCFRAFDEIVTRWRLEKIKTVGDAYLAVCGLPAPDKDHAINVVSAAKEIKKYMADRWLQTNGNTFKIRIGIHTGSVVAGIVGMKKFAYDIWGDTVNTAARMEQNCEPGEINISHTTNALVEHQFQTEFRGEIEAKNKGVLKMYYVK